NRRLVVLPVAVGVLQYLDAPARFELAVHAERIVAHFDDPEPAIGAEVNGDGAVDQRLGGDQFSDHAGPGTDTGQRLTRRQRPRTARPRSRLERIAELTPHLADDLVFQPGREARRPVVVDHGIGSLVAALVQHALRRDVARDVIAVGVDPQTFAIQL